MNLEAMCAVILDEASTQDQLRQVLREYADTCSEVSGVHPDPSFDAWAHDAFLEGGVAINSAAAANCVLDYRRTVIFLRGIYAAIVALRERFSPEPIKILYAGCGPYATLLMPLLARFDSSELDIIFLDYHQASLDSVSIVLEHLDCQRHKIELLQADACHYQHPESPHLVIAETMQKGLEQEPQFEVTANLAPQLCAGGIFVPQKIDLALALGKPEAHWKEAAFAPVSLGSVFTLTQDNAWPLMQIADIDPATGNLALPPIVLDLAAVSPCDHRDVLVLTTIQVFSSYQLASFDAQITLPLRCAHVAEWGRADSVRATYELGSYPRLCVEILSGKSCP